jgi:Zn-dependent peptidase ImmA (M78 family)
MEWGMKVQLVDKGMLFPAFGKADPHTQMAYVRNDLPKSVQSFVAAHELYHLSDKTMGWGGR